MCEVNIMGTMVADAQIKYLPSGLPVGSFSIAVNQDYKKQDGTKVEKTSFFEVKVMGKQSETIAKFFSKGSRIGITGELEQETWKAQDGSNRSKVIIKLRSFTFIDRKSDNQQSGGYGQQQQYQQPQQQQNNGYQQPQQQQGYQPPVIDVDENSIPF